MYSCTNCTPMTASFTGIDKQLIKLMVKGDENAFKKVYDAYYDKLYYYCLQFVKSEDLAQELLQDVFVKLWEQRDKINPDLSFNAYFYKMTRNHTYDFLKKAARDQRLKEEMMLSVIWRHSQEEDNLTYAEYDAIVKQSIHKLPTQRKLIFQLSRHDGMSYEEIAKSLGISKNTVKVQIFRALKTIKKHLQMHTDFTVALLVGSSLFIQYLSL